MEEHTGHLIIVLEILLRNCLRLNFVKCGFYLPQVDVLGYVGSSAGISVDRSKLGGLDDVPLPTTGKQVQSFLGFCNFFRRFIPAMATIAAPLDSLRNLASVDLDESQAAAISTLKKALISAPLLAFPNFARPFGLATDASDLGLGVALYQPAGSSWLSPPDKTSSIITFFSRALSKSERQYSTTKRELLAIVFGLLKCRYYLWGRKFTLFTDHRALTFLMTQRDASPLLQRWFLEIMEFEFDIEHIPGIVNILPD